MRFVLTTVLAIFLSLLFTSSDADDKITVSLFYKEREPSQRVLERVEEMLEKFDDLYRIEYFAIEDEQNSEILEAMGLPSTHFPFAVVINGKYTANIDGKTVSFVHFPLFMKGIGRHEGNWSVDHAEKVLLDLSLLAEENILPELDKEAETTECED